MTTGGEVEEFGEGRYTSGMCVQRLLLRHKLQELPQAIQRHYSSHSWSLRNPLYSLGVGICIFPIYFLILMVTCHAARAWL